MRLASKLLISSMVTALAVPASAAYTVRFELGGAHQAAFTVLEKPMPATYLLGSSFDLPNVTGTFEGVSGTRTLRFFSNALGGGFAVLNSFVVSRVQLYAGTESSPSFYSGDYQLIDPVTGRQAGMVVYRNGTVADVPEPRIWLMLITGFGLVGGALRRRRSSAAFA